MSRMRFRKLGQDGQARRGELVFPRGSIQTPAFIAVGTKATVKAVLPESVAELGAQAVLANAYHLYLQPGPAIVEEAGGLGSFMHWDMPTFTDSGGAAILNRARTWLSSTFSIPRTSIPGR